MWSVRCIRTGSAASWAELGAEAPSIPVHLKVSVSLGRRTTVLKEKDLNFNVFVHQKWTPFLMMLTLFNSLQQMNEYADENDLPDERQGGDGWNQEHQTSPPCSLPSEMRFRPPMCAWRAGGGDKFNRLFLNPVASPKLKSVDVTGRPSAGAPRRDDRECVDAFH